MELGHGNGLGGYSEAYAEDDGSAQPGVREALAQARRSGSQEDYLQAVAQLCLSRLLVPLLSAGDETTSHDPERHAEMSAVLLQHPDGRKAMLAFTGVDALQTWHAQARPIPATLDVVADAAVQSQAGTLLVDFEGPEPLAIEGEVLEQLAQSRRLVRLDDGGFGWLATRRPDVPAEDAPAADAAPGTDEVRR